MVAKIQLVGYWNLDKITYYFKKDNSVEIYFKRECIYQIKKYKLEGNIISMWNEKNTKIVAKSEIISCSKNILELRNRNVGTREFNLEFKCYKTPRVYHYLTKYLEVVPIILSLSISGIFNSLWLLIYNVETKYRFLLWSFLLLIILLMFPAYHLSLGNKEYFNNLLNKSSIGDILNLYLIRASMTIFTINLLIFLIKDYYRVKKIMVDDYLKNESLEEMNYLLEKYTTKD